tara:strand:+ start:210 stop:1526 length:1317 start_codon:yes stop_codon:yes gene_type:complete
MKSILKVVFISSILFLYFVTNSDAKKSCSFREDITGIIIAPLWENYKREYSEEKNDKILSQRKTINIFLAWNQQELFFPYANNKKLNSTQFGAKKSIGLNWQWRTSKPNIPGLLLLANIEWNYHYVGQKWSNFEGKEKFVTKRKWDHSSDWGKTVWVNYKDEGYPDVVGNEAERRFNQNFSGVVLDWWHDNHPGPGTNTKARRQIAKNIKNKTKDNFLIIGNTNWYKDLSTHDLINGVFLELIPKKKSPKSKHSCNEIKKMENLLILHDKELRYPKIVAFEPRMVRFQKRSIYKKFNKHDWWNNFDLEIIKKKNYDFIQEYNFNSAKLFAAMAMIIPEHGYLNFSDNYGHNPVGHHRTYYYQFYDIDMGKPISLMTSIIEGIAYKKYERGIIVYNRLPVAAVVKFPGGRVENLKAYSGNFFWNDPLEEQENQKLLLIK